MMPNNRKYQPQRLQRTTNSLSGHGMLLHDRPLRRCEITAFFQNFIGHSNFPEVMQITTAPQSDYIFFFHSEETPEICGIARQSLTMTFGVRIARFHAEPQGTQYRIDGFEFIGKLFQFEQGTYARKQFLGADRLS